MTLCVVRGGPRHWTAKTYQINCESGGDFFEDSSSAVVAQSLEAITCGTRQSITPSFQDNGSPPMSASTTLWVFVRDSDDQNPAFTRQNYHAEIWESHPFTVSQASESFTCRDQSLIVVSLHPKSLITRAAHIYYYVHTYDEDLLPETRSQSSLFCFEPPKTERHDKNHEQSRQESIFWGYFNANFLQYRSSDQMSAS